MASQSEQALLLEIPHTGTLAAVKASATSRTTKTIVAAEVKIIVAVVVIMLAAVAKIISGVMGEVTLP